jgi:hypothetical protein
MYDNHHMWSHSHLSHTPFNPLPLTLQTLYPCYKGRGIEGRGRGLAFHTLPLPLEGPNDVFHSCLVKTGFLPPTAGNVDEVCSMIGCLQKLWYA